MFGWGKKRNDPSEQGDGDAEEGSYRSENQNGHSVSDAGDQGFSRGIIFDSVVVASPYEKASILRMFTELRKEGSFCDVAFLCQGILFRAHRVIVSSWSRWLRALLTEGSDEEVVSLDVFDPDAFGKVLDYMYGAELVVSLQNADRLIKVIRRLEMIQLETQCWRYLISIIDSTNCEQLHELADKYDCPPLKLSAWRLLQQTVPGYDVAPNLDRDVKAFAPVSTGFGGPGENPYVDNGFDDDIFKYNSDDEEIPSLFRPTGEEGMPEGLDDDEDGDGNHSQADSYDARNKKAVIIPSELPPTATASEVVKAWAARLNNVYELCMPPDWRERQRSNGHEDEDEDNNENVEDNDAKVNEKKDKKGGGIFGWGRPSGDSISETDIASPNKSPDNKKSRAPKRKPRRLPRAANASYDWQGELERIYTSLKMPEKISEIPTILKMFKGKEDEMLGTLLTKYKKQMSPDLYEYLDHLHATFETASEA